MNKIWYNQSFVYFHLNRNSGKFCKEFNFIRKELYKLDEKPDLVKLLPPYKSKPKKE